MALFNLQLQFNSYDLKIIALITMVIDHVGHMFFPEIWILRIIGRIAFILYAFMLVEGTFYTKNITKYMYRVFLWALFSEIPYDLFNYNDLIFLPRQNIFFTLWIGLVGINYFNNHKNEYLKNILASLFFLALAIFLRVDYSWYGVLLIFVFYWFRELEIVKYIFAQGIGMFYSVLQTYAFVGFFPILFYNGKQGKKIGTIYYSFYGLHLLALYIISKLSQLF
ncbi:MAG: TraX family protein [Weeksellaceae bacterium]